MYVYYFDYLLSSSTSFSKYILQPVFLANLQNMHIFSLNLHNTCRNKLINNNFIQTIQVNEIRQGANIKSLFIYLYILE